MNPASYIMLLLLFLKIIILFQVVQKMREVSTVAMLYIIQTLRLLLKKQSLPAIKQTVVLESARLLLMK